MQSSVTYTVQTVAGGYLVSVGQPGGLAANSVIVMSQAEVLSQITGNVAAWVAASVPSSVPSATLPMASS